MLCSPGLGVSVWLWLPLNSWQPSCLSVSAVGITSLSHHVCPASIFLGPEIQTRVGVAGPAVSAGCWRGARAPAVQRLTRPVLPQVVSRGVFHAILLKYLPLTLTQLLHKLGLLTRFSPFCRASTQSLAEVLQQLGASPELRAVLSYIFPTYGGWLLAQALLSCCPPNVWSFFPICLADKPG